MQRRRNWRPVAILSPDDLIAQATKLIRPPPAGPPLQADLRRAISSAYYAVFHLTLAAAADVVVGRIHRGSPNYALVYRSVDHRGFKELCEVTRKSSLRQNTGITGRQAGLAPILRALRRRLLRCRRHDTKPTMIHVLVSGSRPCSKLTWRERHCTTGRQRRRSSERPSWCCFCFLHDNPQAPVCGRLLRVHSSAASTAATSSRRSITSGS